MTERKSLESERTELVALSDVDLVNYCGDDASKWAEVFCRLKHKQGWSAADIDESLMLGWFANAIERSSDVRSLAAQSALARIRKVRDGYANQAKFADVEQASYFREFIRRLDEAVSPKEGTPRRLPDHGGADDGVVEAYPYNIKAIATVISLSYGEDPEADAELGRMCTADSKPVKCWEVYEEQAKALFIWFNAILDALSKPAPVAQKDCEVCGGDCASANPPVAYCPVKERKQRKEAISKAREMLELGINIQATGDATNAIVTGVIKSLLDHIDDLDADLKCAIAVGRMAARPAPVAANSSAEAQGDGEAVDLRDLVLQQIKRARKAGESQEMLARWICEVVRPLTYAPPTEAKDKELAALREEKVRFYSHNPYSEHNEVLKARAETAERRVAESEASWRETLRKERDSGLNATRLKEQFKRERDEAREALKAEPTTAMIDAGVAFALNVSLPGEYRWSQDVADLYKTMRDAATRAAIKQGE